MKAQHLENFCLVPLFCTRLFLFIIQVTPADNGSRLPTPSPVPPPINHHSFYIRQHGNAFGDSSDSEYYSETVSASETGEDDRSTYIISPAQSQILVKASKSPNFPQITVSIHQGSKQPAWFFWIVSVIS